jgi:ATP-dependent RNA helicase DDX51/DBP6
VYQFLLTIPSLTWNIDLEPLPQPRPIPEPEYRPVFSSLPAWLEKPVIASPKDHCPFQSLQIGDQILSNLEKSGYKTAFPVQSKLIPLMVNGIKKHEGDICVSAPTGSGKTFAYLLPILDRIKDPLETRLRAIIVVPTRDLVFQAEQVAKLAGTGTKTKIGTAVGSATIANERDQILKKGQQYDPQKHEELRVEAQRRLGTGFMEDDSLFDDLATLLPGHIPKYSSKVDILICTPGRLVEHIRSTPGFSLQHLQYLVIDEADKLLDESFQEWVDVILQTYETHVSTNIIDQVLAKTSAFRKRRLQKVILSATMTRDLGKLAALKLQRPTLLAIIQDDEDDESSMIKDSTSLASAPVRAAEVVELPSHLSELAVPVGSGAEKPLYLRHLVDSLIGLTGKLIKFDRLSNALPRVLVFVNNTEDAMRLSHILSALLPSLEGLLGTLTKTSSQNARKVLADFQKGKIKVLIATDRAARGLDVEDVSEVVNYDMPKNVTSYVHRVGRTARAGKAGSAWTFFTDSEAAWFWNAIARSETINRHQGKVERASLKLINDDTTVNEYERALESLKSAVISKH